MGLVRRLYFGSKTLFRAALLLPILAFMVIFSYNVDCSGLFQGALAPRRIVDLMLQGYDVTNYDQMDERQVVQAVRPGCGRGTGGDRHRFQPGADSSIGS